MGIVSVDLRMTFELLTLDRRNKHVCGDSIQWPLTSEYFWVIVFS